MGKVNLVWKAGERTWVNDHWEYADGCTPLDKCFEISSDFDEALDLLSEWTEENGGCQFRICTDNHWEAELEERNMKRWEEKHAKVKNRMRSRKH